VRVAANDRDGLEHLARYLARPPVATDRLTLLADGRVALRFKRPLSDGTEAVVFTLFDRAANTPTLGTSGRRGFYNGSRPGSGALAIVSIGYAGLLAEAFAVVGLAVASADGRPPRAVGGQQPALARPRQRRAHSVRPLTEESRHAVAVR